MSDAPAPSTLLGPAEIRDLADLLARVRAAPGRVSFGHSGVGTLTHLAPVLMLSRAGVSANHVACRGGGPSIAGLLAGDAEFVFSTLPQATPLVREGQLRGLAVSLGQRLANDLQGDADAGVVAGRPSSLLAGLYGGIIGMGDVGSGRCHGHA